MFAHKLKKETDLYTGTIACMLQEDTLIHTSMYRSEFLRPEGVKTRCEEGIAVTDTSRMLAII